MYLSAALLTLLALAALWLSSRSSSAAKLNPPRADVSPEARAEVDRLVAEGRHVEAIKAVRTHTSWGLVDAKSYVDAVRRGDAHPPLPDTRAELPPQVRQQVEEMAARGELVKAVKLVRQHTGLGLVEATDYVRGLHRT